MKKTEVIAMLLIFMGVVGYYYHGESFWPEVGVTDYLGEKLETTGIIQELDEESDEEMLPTARVLLDNGSVITATIAPNCVVAVGDSVAVSGWGASDGEGPYMVFPSQSAYEAHATKFSP